MLTCFLKIMFMFLCFYVFIKHKIVFKHVFFDVFFMLKKPPDPPRPAEKCLKGGVPQYRQELGGQG